MRLALAALAAAAALSAGCAKAAPPAPVAPGGVLARVLERVVGIHGQRFPGLGAA